MKLLLKLPICAHLWSEPPRGGRGSLCLLEGFFFFFYGGSYPRAAPFSEEAPCLLLRLSLWSFETPAISGALGRTDLQTPPPFPGLPGQGPVYHGEQHLSVTAAGSHLCLATQGRGTECHWCEGLHYILLLLFEGLWKS